MNIDLKPRMRLVKIIFSKAQALGTERRIQLMLLRSGFRGGWKGSDGWIDKVKNKKVLKMANKERTIIREIKEIRYQVE